MVNIEITLLLTKRTDIKVDGLDATVAINRVGYAVVAGEDNATTIQVNYFADYRNQKRYVYMKNSKGGYETLDFPKGQSSVTFTLPNTMTFAGKSVLVFFSDDEASAVTVWTPVIIPILETGVDYKAVALANENLLIETIEKSETAIKNSQLAVVRTDDFSKIINDFEVVVTQTSKDSAQAVIDSTAAKKEATEATAVSVKAIKDSAEAKIESSNAEKNSIASNNESAIANANSIAALGKAAAAENTANEVRSEFDQIVEGKIGITQDILSTDPLTAPSSEAVRNALDDLTQVITPTNQQSEVVHLDGTSAGFVDELIMSSEPTQVVSPNLIKQPYIQSSLTTQGITFTVNADFSIKVSGMPTNFASIKLCMITLPIGTYVTRGCIYKKCTMICRNINPQEGELTYLDSTKMTLNRAMLLEFYLQVHPTDTPNNEIVYPMLNEGSTALPYQPYTGQPSPDNPIPINVVSSPVEVMSRGLNIFQANDINNSSARGTIFNYDSKQQVFTINGTTTVGGWNNVIFPLSCNIQPNKNYKLTIVELGGTCSNKQGAGVAFGENLYYKSLFINFDGSQGTQNFNKPLQYIGILINDIIENIVFDNYSFKLMLNFGTTALPYEPYNAITTQIPLETVATETTPSKTVELLGEYNTKTNVLGQKWGKIVINGNDEVWETATSAEGINTVIFYTSKLKNVAKPYPEYQDRYKTKFSRFVPVPGLFSNDSKQGAMINQSANLYIRIDKTYATNLVTFRRWLQTNPLTVYYELATPEILTLNPAPPIPTLAGTTNIYTVNNASPVTFNITELLDGGNQTNVVLKDKDDNVLNPRTVAQQVRINDDGETLDRELERIQAAISGVDSDLSAEISARTAADTQIRDDLINGTLIVKKATDAVLADNANFAITQPPTKNDTTIATTEFVRQAISDVKNIDIGTIVYVGNAFVASGTVVLNAYIKRQVNFVSGFIPSPSSMQGNMLVEERFRPKKDIVIFDCSYAVNVSNNTYRGTGKITINRTGVIDIVASNGGIPGMWSSVMQLSDVYFGYEIT